MMSTDTPRAAGTHLGPYELESRIGTGGMGEVYKANDARLNRTVAIKLLPPGKVADSEVRQRFTQEARAASALNHTNIITIYDIGNENGLDYIVMEYVAGKTLDALIPAGGLRLSVALHYAVQIASALTAAHSAGIVHRDLKPGNVMVTDDRVVKVLDFGLAKLGVPVELSSRDDAPTLVITSAHTVEGTIAGTAAFMSPEQAEGRPVDGRSDIFSFGVLLYEMLTGISPFHRGAAISTLTAILRDQPKPLRDEAPDIPAEVDRIVMRCLRKDPSRRFQHAADLKVALEELKEESDSGTLAPIPSPNPAKRGPSRRMIWRGAALAALVATAAGAWLLIRRLEPVPETRAPVPLTALSGIQEYPSLSPDGKQVAFSWGENTEHKRIHLKLIGAGNPLRISNGPGEDTQPMWSPDGSSIAFIRNSKEKTTLMVMAALGGAERVASPLKGRPLQQGVFRRLFGWSRDGKWLICFSPDGLEAIALDTGEHRKLLPDTLGHDQYTTPAVSPDGGTVAMVSRRGGSQTGIVLASLSPDMKITGEPRYLNLKLQFTDNLAWTLDGKELIFSAGPHGYTTLWRVPVAGGEPKQLVVAGMGDQATLAPDPAGHGTRLVYRHQDRDTNIWQIHLTDGKLTGKATRVIASTRRDFEPRHSPDGRKIAFSSDRSGLVEVWVCDVDGSNATQLTHFTDGITSGARWSPDGKRLVFLSTESGQSEIYMMDAQGGPITRLTNDPGHDTAPSWSHDGKWIYFGSNRSGMHQVWKMSPEARRPIQVTKHGGVAPIESWDGKTIYYAMPLGEDGVWKVPAEGGEETNVIPIHNGWGNFDVTPKGIMFLTIEQPPGSIWFLPFGGGKPMRLAGLEGQADFGLSVSPAEGSIMYSQVDRDTNELALIENFH